MTVILVNTSAGGDYKEQSSTCVYSPGAMAGDTQCLSIPIIDNNVCDGDRAFRVTLATFDPLVQVIPGQENLTVEMMDDESTLYSLILGCLWVLYLHYL